MHSTRKQFIRYVIVGLSANVTGFLLYIFVTSFGVSPILTVSIFYLIYICLTFYFNKTWSFDHHGQRTVAAMKYLFAYFVSYVLNVILLAYFNSYLGFSHIVVQAAAVVPIAALLFLMQKYWVFQKKSTVSVVERSL